MNVYDFDKTIYKSDSTADFFLWCLGKYPKTLLCLPYIGAVAIPFALGITEKTVFKQRFYRFLRFIPNTEQAVEKFWDEKQDGIKQWYKTLQANDDVIISASPEFLIKPICRRLGITCAMASRVDPKSGKYDGINCHGEEKVRRFYEHFGDNTPIDSFYSDSLSDSPLAHLAKSSYIIKGEKLTDWQEYESRKGKKKAREKV